MSSCQSFADVVQNVFSFLVFCRAFDFCRKSETQRSHIPSSLATSTNIHFLKKKKFEILVTFLNSPGFLPNLNRSLFMNIRQYPEVIFFFYIKIWFFRILLINGLSFSARKHFIHSVVKIFEILITFLNYPGIYQTFQRLIT